MLYETKSWAGKNQHKHKVSVPLMRLLCWMCGKTICGRIRNVDIRENQDTQ